MLSQQYRKLHDYAHYLNTSFCSWTAALRTYCQSQEKPYQKTPAAPKMLCYQPGLYWDHFYVWDLDPPPVPGPGQAVALSRVNLRIAVFHGKGNKSAAGGCSELAPLQTEYLQMQRAPCLSNKLILPFCNAALGHIFCDRHSSKAFLKVGEKQEHAETLV